MKFGFVDEHRKVWPVRVMCAVLGLSASGYYAWRTRSKSPRSAANRALMDDIRLMHAESSGTCQSPPTALSIGLHQPSRGRAQSGITPSTFSGKITGAIAPHGAREADGRWSGGIGGPVAVIRSASAPSS